MSHLKKLVSRALLISTLSLSSGALTAAPDLSNTPLNDGKLTEDELAVILVTAQQQLIRLTERATEEYEPKLKDSQPNMPEAWMLMKDGETVKRISIGEQGAEVPASARIYMYRAAIKAIARGGEINAAAILYTGKLNEQSDTEVLVIEHEHRLGVSANNVVAYDLKGGDLVWSEPVSQKKPFEWFYDEKSRKNVSASGSN